MTDVVEATLREWRQGRFSYGQTDCMLSIGRYLARTGHADVTPQFIGRYDTHDGAVEMMAAHGGVAGLMALAGAAPKEGMPERGDVVEVFSRDDDGSIIEIGGICTGDCVALRLERGMVEVRLRLVSYGGVWHGCRR